MRKINVLTFCARRLIVLKIRYLSLIITIRKNALSLMLLFLSLSTVYDLKKWWWSILLVMFVVVRMVFRNWSINLKLISRVSFRFVNSSVFWRFFSIEFVWNRCRLMSISICTLFK